MALQVFLVLLLGVYFACLLFIFCYSLMQLHLTFLFRRSLQQARPVYPAPETWPDVTVQLPVYNERYVVARLLDAVCAFDYPKEKLQIQVLDDSTDETVGIIAQKVAAFQKLGINIVHICRPERTGFKAGALQYGLQQATGEFICIFDADFVPEADFLQQTIPAFTSPEIGVVQTRWGHLNAQNSMLTRLQAFGLNAHFTVEQSGRNFGKHFINFNGTAGVWRKTCIASAGGWEADTLTEDLDLSYRAQLKGWQFRYLQNVVVPAELPAAMPALKQQQYRWTKGAAETARKHRSLLWNTKTGLETKLHAWFHLLNSSVYLCVFLASLISVALLFAGKTLPFSAAFFRVSAVFLSGFLVLAFFYWLAYRETNNNARWWNFLPQFFLFLTVSMGLAFYNAIAVLEGYLGRKTPFIRTPKYNLTNEQKSWQKTAYTLSGTSGFTIVEGMLALLFWLALFAAFWLQDFRMLYFHFMLALGYSLVFFYSLKHSLVK
ncbi:glycosyltransferase [Adhaeribacter sp. BT258]|uniref:Glycosyltransferase n=1 Tax=Adhaeribacter terrigena TaxID=2793070 RepID=A0ABS1BZ52_9BACT|nr:cellulose synthase family protein [Adhaeribacter terrigena]MBK0402445.1 glycosyltransferase [Adhaeribacter terrigena]